MEHRVRAPAKRQITLGIYLCIYIERTHQVHTYIYIALTLARSNSRFSA